MAVAAGGMGGLSLLGWIFGIPILIRLHPSLASMKANTALGLVLAGAALWWEARSGAGSRKGRWIPLCSLLVAAIGGLNLLEYLGGWDFGIDELLFSDPWTSAGNFPGRLSPASAASFFLMGISLLVIDAESSSTFQLSEILAIAAGFIAFLALIAYAYDVRSLYGVYPYVSMALHTAGGIFLLSVGILLSRPEKGITRVIAAPTEAARIARRLLPSIILIPPLIGLIAIQGSRFGLYEPLFRLSLMVVSTVGLLTAVVWSSTARLTLSEAGRAVAEEQARTRELQFESILNNTPIVLYVKDLEGRYVLVNNHFERVFHVTKNRVVGKSDFDLFPEMAPRLRRNDKDALAQGGIQVEETLLVDGKPRTYISGKFPVQGEGKKVVALCGILTDVTHFKNLEEQFRQIQKMESIGRLTGGVAHDFNNMLTVINSYAALLLRDLPAGTKASDSAQQIVTAGLRAADLTKQLLAFSRKQILQPRVLNLNTVVSGAGKLLRHLIGEDVDLHIALAPDLGTVQVDPVQIEQVILNLAVNARDAMPRGGRLTIETANVPLGADYCREHAEVKPGNYVLLAISDTGHGMDKEVLAHIFEPFFTTKELGKGTGLGLATVYGIITQSGGHVWVYSEPGHGTMFKIYFPRLDRVTGDPKAASPREEIVPGGTECILAVEDEPLLGTLVKDALEEKGYRIILAAGPDEALSAAKEHGEKIDLLLTDVIMPKMSGNLLAKEILKICPGVKVLYVSGYTDNAIVHHGVLDQGIAFLQKPFTPEALARKVRTVLDGREPDGS
ncbi:MAG: ATP-binding protein [Bdellovibrionota bacterium]